ncbi:MAG: hypothetical protein A3J09_00195 [Candidatus Zambryskibacteria bacterium RIFCSPLOWO2_02_FULL_51_21]|nr:MAG: hypothetical protein A3J09_00195 [Candidatus Zambryskibacteria bacterium RIFCSPLOWO2_02_FULL_51_21]
MKDEPIQDIGIPKTKEEKPNEAPKWLSMSEAALLTPYSAEYLSLLARKKKIASKKIGNAWYTTKQVLDDYMQRQMVRSQLTNGNPHEISATVQSELEPRHTYGQDIRRYRLEQELAGGGIEHVERALEKVLDKKIRETSAMELPEENKIRRHFRIVTSSKVLVAVTLAAILIFSILPVPVVFSFVSRSVEYAREALNDANTVLGFRPGTHANEILLLDKEGNISIMGHIETEGQFRSFAAQGIAPIVVDSTTTATNLSADLLDGHSAEEFTLAFVTKNGNMTTEDVILDGNAEVGKTLMVKGATKLLSTLEVGGKLKVFGNAEFRQAINVLGPAYFESLVTLASDAKVGGSMDIEENLTVRGNLNVKKNISARGSIESASAITGRSGSFGSLGVNGSLSAGGKIVLGNSGDVLTIDSKNVTLDSNGNAAFDGSVSAAGFGGTNLEVTSATSTNFYTESLTVLLSTFTSIVADDMTVGALTATNATTTNATTTNATSTNLYSSSLDADNADLTELLFIHATGTAATTTNLFSTTGTFDDLYVNDYQQNDGTFLINSSVATGDIFAVNDSAITSGTLIHQTLTANAGNGQVSYGQTIDLVDSTSAGGGYSAFSINLSGSGTGSGSKTLLSLSPGGSNQVVFDSAGAFRPTTDVSSNTNSVGSPSYYWKNGYFDTITANNLSGTVVSGATSNNTWTVGSTETGDAYKALIFQRNSGSGNALFQWDAGTNDLRFLSVNYPFNATYTVDDSSISTTANLYSGLLTNNTTAGTQKLLSLTNTGTGTTENGIYLNNTGTGTTAIEVAGTWTNGLIIPATAGNVGIGTTTPNNKLDIYSTTKSAIGFSGASGTTYKWTMGMDVTNGGRFSIASSTALGTTDRFVIDGNGNVGIGTTVPGKKLEVSVGTANEYPLRINSSSGYTIDIGALNATYAHFDTNTAAGFYFYDNVTTGGSFNGPGTGLTGTAASLNIGGSAGTAGTVTTAAQPAITSVGTLTSITTSGPIYRSAAGAGYLNGQYATVEGAGNTSGAIYSIGGSYVPGAGNLGNMYGIGFGYSGGTAGITATNAPINNWGLYVASGGTPTIFMSSDTGNIYINGSYNGAGTGLTGTAASLTVGNATNVTTTIGGLRIAHYNRGDPYGVDGANPTYDTGAMGRSTQGPNEVFTNGRSGFIDTWGGTGYPGSPATTHVQGFQTMHYSGGYGIQIAGQYDQDKVYVRQATAGTLRDWRLLLDSGNYGGYSAFSGAVTGGTYNGQTISSTANFTGTLNSAGAMSAYSYSGNSNVAGTGNASYHPSGIYSTGTNWLYGTMYLNNNVISDAGTYNGQTISSAANFTGTMAVASTVTGGTYNGQTISSAANLTGTLAVGSQTNITGNQFYCSSGGTCYFNSSGTGVTSIGNGTSGKTVYINNALQPSTDNAFNVGDSTHRYGCYYYVANTIGTCVSDERLKSDIRSLTYDDALYKISKLQPRAFSYKDDPNHNTNHGLIAQEVLGVAPELVVTGDDGYYKLSYGDIQWLAIEAMQELYAQLMDIKATVLAFADRFVSREIVATEKLCIGATCMNELQLKSLIEKSGVVTYAETMDTTDTATSTDTTTASIVDTTASSTPSTTDTATSTPPVITEPAATSTEPVIADTTATSTEPTADTATSTEPVATTQ